MTKDEFKELSLKRVELAKLTKKTGFDAFFLDQRKTASNIYSDVLSKSDRKRVNNAKDKLTYPDDEEDLFY